MHIRKSIKTVPLAALQAAEAQNGMKCLSLLIMMPFSAADHLACTAWLSEKIMQSLPD